MAKVVRAGFIEWYRGLEAKEGKEEKTIRIFDRQEYYTAHGENAIFIADTFFKTREVIKYLGGARSTGDDDNNDDDDHHDNDGNDEEEAKTEKKGRGKKAAAAPKKLAPAKRGGMYSKTGPAKQTSSEKETGLASVTIRPQKLATIVREMLLTRRERVELYGKDDNDEWIVCKKASPGNLQSFEELLAGASTDTTVVLAVKLSMNASERVVGVAFVDAAERSIEVCQFSDSDRFANLESIVVQRGAKECLLHVDTSVLPADRVKLLSLFERCGVPTSERKAAEFKSIDVEQDIKRLIGSIEHHFTDLEKKHAMSAVSCLIRYLELLRDESGHGHFRLSSLDLSQYMKLDQAAVHALNLFPSATDSDKNMSLFGLLNKGKTPMGHRLLTQWIKQPLRDITKIERRLNYVDIFTEQTEIRQQMLEEHFKAVPDLDRLAKKFQKGKASLQNIVQLYQFVVRLPAILTTLRSYDGIHRDIMESEMCSKLSSIVEQLKNFEAMVEQTIDLEALDRHEFIINPAFDERLLELDGEKKKIVKEINKLAEDTAGTLDMELGAKTGGLKLINAAPHGYHFRIPRKSEKVLRENPQYVMLDTRKDGVRFTSAKLKKLSRAYTDLGNDYGKIQADIVESALAIVVSYTPVFERANALLAEMDVLLAFAHVAVNAPQSYKRPTILPSGSGVLHLRACRHPCMEMVDGMQFIANNVIMDKGESNVQVITGPNMGGKSTYIRQVGVIALMAQIGCFVPCESATISVLDCVLARVGAGDSQLKGVSTFMKEMLEASAILRSATSDSLVIIDELGRGTSTYDGFGLAWAITEHIAKHIQSFAMFATHFHELTSLADTLPNVINKHVTAQTSSSSITMMYEVKDGPCDRSFGIHVAQLANFPSEVVDMARVKAAELEEFGAAAQELQVTSLATTTSSSSPSSSSSLSSELKTMSSTSASSSSSSNSRKHGRDNDSNGSNILDDHSKRARTATNNGSSSSSHSTNSDASTSSSSSVASAAAAAAVHERQLRDFASLPLDGMDVTTATARLRELFPSIVVAH